MARCEAIATAAVAINRVDKVHDARVIAGTQATHKRFDEVRRHLVGSHDGERHGKHCEECGARCAILEHDEEQYQSHRDPHDSGGVDFHHTIHIERVAAIEGKQHTPVKVYQPL